MYNITSVIKMPSKLYSRGLLSNLIGTARELTAAHQTKECARQDRSVDVREPVDEIKARGSTWLDESWGAHACQLMRASGWKDSAVVHCSALNDRTRVDEQGTQDMMRTRES